MPELQHLCLDHLDVEGELSARPEFPVFQHPLKLRHISSAIILDLYQDMAPDEPMQCLEQLSALVNLEHVDLYGLPSNGSPGGWPSQLVKLTCLRANYNAVCDAAQQFQHLSCLTALRELSVTGCTLAGQRSLPGIQHLSQLTCLALVGRATRIFNFSTQLPKLEFSTAITNSWACRTALQSLTLSYCTVEPAMLAALTQLKALSLKYITALGDAAPDELLLAVSKLSLLTELCCCGSRWGGAAEPPLPTAAEAYTALTTSTRLCSLQLQLKHNPVLFQPGVVYPQLRVVDLSSGCRRWPGVTHICEQQLQLLCSCCPSMDSLTFGPCHSSSPTAWLPLLQLSALTNLRVYEVGAAAAVEVAAQLTGLRALALWGSLEFTDPALLQLTALTALEDLELGLKPSPDVYLVNLAPSHTHPDVWKQLLRHFLHNPAFRTALLQHSSGAAAAPAERRLAQLAVALAEELAALSPSWQQVPVPVMNPALDHFFELLNP